MDGPVFDDPGPPIPAPVSRVRRALTVAILLTLVASMVVLAFVSGRGVVTPPPPPGPSLATPGTLIADAARIAIVDTAGGLSTTDALGGSLVRYGTTGTKFLFPTWSPDGTRIAAIAEQARRGRDRRVHCAGRGSHARRSSHRLQQRGPTPVLCVLVARRTPICHS